MASYIVLWNEDEEDWVAADDEQGAKTAAARVLTARGLSPDTRFQLVPIPGRSETAGIAGGRNDWFRIEDHLESACLQPQGH